MMHFRPTSRFIFALPAAVTLMSSPVLAEQEPCIGNSAPVTGPAAFGGAAIKYGAEIAIEEINEKGGVLGKSYGSSSTMMRVLRRAVSTIRAGSCWPTNASSFWAATIRPSVSPRSIRSTESKFLTSV